MFHAPMGRFQLELIIGKIVLFIIHSQKKKRGYFSTMLFQMYKLYKIVGET